MKHARNRIKERETKANRRDWPRGPAPATPWPPPPRASLRASQRTTTSISVAMLESVPFSRSICGARDGSNCCVMPIAKGIACFACSAIFFCFVFFVVVSFVALCVVVVVWFGFVSSIDDENNSTNKAFRRVYVCVQFRSTCVCMVSGVKTIINYTLLCFRTPPFPAPPPDSSLYSHHN